MDSLGKFAELRRLLLLVFPGSVTSWFRSHDRNRVVGGGRASWHLAGLAVDIVLDDMSSASRELCVVRAKRIGLDAFDETDHIHLEVRG